MKILALSGSTRKNSSNGQLLRILAQSAPKDLKIDVFDGLGELPIFCADLEGALTPAPVQKFCRLVKDADGIVISSPEYVHAIPGGLKNALDWLVQRPEIIHKPVALLHASHRGEDMLFSLRLVLGTVTNRFQEDNFEQFALMAKSAQEIKAILGLPQNRARLASFLERFRRFAQQEQTQTAPD